ncbi:MAG: Uma2 family endonuclease [Acidobacteria bacterium]|nr:Uma2 family endonuclease [Acidobacteriota bacterium]
MSRAAQKISYDDYAEFLPDGLIHQIIDGELYMTPAPNPFHQRASKRLQRQLEAYFEAGGSAEVFDAPIDVILSNHDVVQPDIVVVKNAAQISKRGIEGAPFLVVEVLSPASIRTDRTVKLVRYAAFNVPHYWILDPDDRSIECYRASVGEYALVVNAKAPQSLLHPDFAELVIDLAAL